MKKQTSQQAIIKLLGEDNENQIQLRKVAIGKIAGSDYVWNNEIRSIYSDLMNYFHGIEGNLDLNKSIALIGAYGVGKSTIFNIWHEYLRKYYPFNANLYKISSLEEILDDIRKEDYVKRVYCYNKKENTQGLNTSKPIHILINEFGFDYKIKSYGTDINELFEAFMMVRYDVFQKYKKLTHITTNYGTDELKSIFHPKLIDRFKEMFNLIELRGKSFRK